MYVYVFTEFSRTRAHDEIVEEKKIVAVYDNMADAQRKMREEAKRIVVVPGVDYTENGLDYVETVKGKIVLEDDQFHVSHVEENETWRWEIEEHEVGGTSLNNKTISAS